MYNIIFDTKALDFLEKLEYSLSRRIWNKIMSTKGHPLHFFERLSKREDYKLRVGDYRVIAEINSNEMTIQVTIIGHRRNIYKN
ncbi:type II toxin-antitoxin system RelE/ParE family toxin [Candidatus Woesearchaeota archaeon]|jgi:mRNA interferase RelE/StbE|nr:type II toxin-antitoxin system RelE/ParE family toxin [Candidatus Woesearchaeota archaeon]MBT6044783.1 type II toxin-antitoxin system RelE/ParE family toxin [Candidatus Woesearchaeota archaeon]